MALQVMFTPISVKQGTKEFKEQAMAEIVKYYEQLHDMTALGRVCSDYLKTKNNGDALHEIELSKDKRCVKIKRRAYVDGRPQIAYITKE